MTVVALAMLGALVWKFVDALKYAAARNWSALVTQVIVWVAGIAAIFLFASTPWAGDLRINNLPLDQINWAGQLLLGLSATSLFASGTYELTQALDNNGSINKPPLILSGYQPHLPNWAPRLVWDRGGSGPVDPPNPTPGLAGSMPVTKEPAPRKRTK